MHSIIYKTKLLVLNFYEKKFLIKKKNVYQKADIFELIFLKSGFLQMFCTLFFGS